MLRMDGCFHRECPCFGDLHKNDVSTHCMLSTACTKMICPYLLLMIHIISPFFRHQISIITYTYPSELILNYFDGVISLVSVFLYEELGWENAHNVKQTNGLRIMMLFCLGLVVYPLSLAIFGLKVVIIAVITTIY